MESLYAKNITKLLLWITILAVIISTATAMTTDHETDENSLNSNLNEEEDNEYESSHLPTYYSLRLNPKYYGSYASLQHLVNKRLRGSEFLGKRMGSEFLGKKRSDGLYVNKKMGSEFLGRRRRHTNAEQTQYPDTYPSQNTKRLSEFLGGPGKRYSEFLGGPGKKRSGYSNSPTLYFAKKLSKYLNSSFMRPARLATHFEDIYNPRGSEFLGGPGK